MKPVNQDERQENQRLRNSGREPSTIQISGMNNCASDCFNTQDMIIYGHDNQATHLSPSVRVHPKMLVVCIPKPRLSRKKAVSDVSRSTTHPQTLDAIGNHLQALVFFRLTPAMRAGLYVVGSRFKGTQHSKHPDSNTTIHEKMLGNVSAYMNIYIHVHTI